MTVSLAFVAPVGPSASGQSGKANDGWVLTVPKRRAADAPPVAVPPLPSGADSIAPATIQIVMRRAPEARRPRTLRQTVSRTSERIHFAENGEREWLFERNPIDPRRVAATLVDHVSRALVLYDESDLRMTLGIRGWADVVALGFDSLVLDGYKRSEEFRIIGGIRFTRYTQASQKAGLREVWWSDVQALASRFVITDGTGVTHFAVERIRVGVDAAVLRPPEVRFPTYRTYDIADWLERQVSSEGSR